MSVTDTPETASDKERFLSSDGTDLRQKIAPELYRLWQKIDRNPTIAAVDMFKGIQENLDEWLDGNREVFVANFGVGLGDTTHDVAHALFTTHLDEIAEILDDRVVFGENGESPKLYVRTIENPDSDNPWVHYTYCSQPLE